MCQTTCVIDVCLSHILCLAVHVHCSISMNVYVHYLGEREGDADREREKVMNRLDSNLQNIQY